jgi:hypothetical protein
VFVLPPPVDGVSSIDASSVVLGAALSQGLGLSLSSGTEAIRVVDATLSVGPDTDEATIQRLYEGLLDRGSDTSGMAFYDNLLAEGLNQTVVAADILSSSEYLSDHGTQTNQQFVSMLDQSLLGEASSADPNAAGYLAQLVAGTSRATIAITVTNSVGAKTFLASDTAGVYAPNLAGTLAHDLYETGLGREVDPTGLAAFQNTYSILTPLQFANGIAASAEFQADHANQSNSAYVTSLYEAGLGRSPDIAGAAFWTGLLNSGTGRGTVLAGIATSGEATAHLTANLAVFSSSTLKAA